MHFEEDGTYHIYNRSNETVFFNNENYLYFLKKVNKHIQPYAAILAWCLMPNHFHFLIVTNSMGCQYVNENHRPTTQVLSKNIGSLLSAYTRAINKEHGRRGKLFAHNTKAKCLNEESKNGNFLDNCFHYIHQNPLRAGLCNDLKDWEFSSYLDYAEIRQGKLVSKQLTYDMIDINQDNFVSLSNLFIDENRIKGLF